MGTDFTADRRAQTGRPGGMSVPDVSVLVVTYNRAHTLRECIDSILMQTHPSMEILVVDDGSTDDTAQVVGAYGGKILYHSLEHQGLSRVRNSALALARGKWIAFLDSDDYYLYPDVIRDYLDRFREDPGLDAVSSGWQIVDDRGRLLAETSPWKDAPEFDLESCLIWKPTFPSAKIFRREILEKAGGFDPAFESAMDTDLFFRILLDGARIGWLRKSTCGLRQSPDAMLGNAPRQSRFLLLALDRVFSSPELPDGIKPKEGAIRYATHQWLAWYLWSRGFREEASAALRDARRHRRERPFNQLIQWRRSFDAHSDRAGFRRIPEAAFLSLSVPVFSLSDSGKHRLARLMEWWWNVWSGYVESEDGGAAAFPSGKIPSVLNLVELTKRCIQIGRNTAPVVAVDRFWSDAAGLGWIPAEDCDKVITLYLACFTRSVFARKLHPAAGCLMKALSATRSLRALRPWWLFIKGAIRHYLLGSRPEDEETE